jgi:hypothetical protein
LSHSASFESLDENAPSKSGTKHTTLDTLTMKVFAADRQDWPASIAATTSSRRSKD